MKRMLTITLILCACTIWQTDITARTRHKDYRTCIGLGFSSFLDGCCELSAEHGFSDRWSVSVSAGFNIRNAFTADSESEEHSLVFDEGIVAGKPSGRVHHESFSIAFWPQGAFNGISLALGAQQSSTEGADIVLTVNYHVPINKRLAACINWSIRGMSMVQNKTGNAAVAGVKILYRF